MGAQIFISYSSNDQKVAEAICDALQSRGYSCWIACRDVGPGENFQESIVKAIRLSKLMLLVFTSSANNSDEIKKEIVLAGRHQLSVVPVRVEDVAPNDALAYEFATRQWIDLFKDWEREIERLASHVGSIVVSGSTAAGPHAGDNPTVPSRAAPLRPVSRAPLLGLLLLAGVGAIAFGVYLYAWPGPLSSSQAPALPTAPSEATAEEREWLNATTVGTIASFNEYLRAFPAGKHAEEARQRIAAARRFDGLWTISLSCPKTATALGYSYDFVGPVNDGYLRAQHGVAGEPASLTLAGQINPDGTAKIGAAGYTGTPAYNQDKRPSGIPYEFQITTRFTELSAEADVILPSGRPCHFAFAKK